jgi:hypothetical protein
MHNYANPHILKCIREISWDNPLDKGGVEYYFKGDFFVYSFGPLLAIPGLSIHVELEPHICKVLKLVRGMEKSCTVCLRSEVAGRPC